MLGLASTRIRPLTEKCFDEIVELAGGRRAHPDHDRRAARNADYILGDAVLELKILDDEGLSKVERQAKLAALFTALDPDRPRWTRRHRDIGGHDACGAWEYPARDYVYCSPHGH